MKSKAFEQFVAFADQQGKVNKPITTKEFEQWKQDFTFNALQGQRYGQSFCNTFDITDHLLYYAPWSVDKINNYIEKNYLERS